MFARALTTFSHKKRGRSHNPPSTVRRAPEAPSLRHPRRTRTGTPQTVCCVPSKICVLCVSDGLCVCSFVSVVVCVSPSKICVLLARRVFVVLCVFHLLKRYVCTQHSEANARSATTWLKWCMRAKIRRGDMREIQSAVASTAVKHGNKVRDRSTVAIAQARRGSVQAAEGATRQALASKGAPRHDPRATKRVQRGQRPAPSERAVSVRSTWARRRRRRRRRASRRRGAPRRPRRAPRPWR